MEFNSIAELEAYINKLAKDAMNNGNAVKETVISAGERHVQSDVYDVYTPNPDNPKSYKRTGELKKDWVAEPTVDGIEVYNNRTDNGKDVSEIVNTGKGYKYDFPYNGVGRPFIKNTADELRNSVELINALRSDLRNMGVDVE